MAWPKSPHDPHWVIYANSVAMTQKYVARKCNSRCVAPLTACYCFLLHGPPSPDLTQMCDTLSNPQVYTCIIWYTDVLFVNLHTSSPVSISISQACIIEHYTGEHNFMHHTSSSSEVHALYIYLLPMHTTLWFALTTAVVLYRAPTHSSRDECVRGARWKYPRRNLTYLPHLNSWNSFKISGRLHVVSDSDI